MFEGYHQPQHHVAMRDGLPVALRPTLLEEAESDWRNHPRYAGKARFFMNIHRQLIDGSAQLARALEQLSDTPESEVKDHLRAMNLLAGADHLISFAHRHHEIEDHGYFPQFIRLYPQLERALGLMDSDHDILETALHGAEAGLNTLKQGKVNRDTLMALHKDAKALNKVLERHIMDEEEVIIPIFLRHG